jgi:hypothetical protein
MTINNFVSQGLGSGQSDQKILKNRPIFEIVSKTVAII